MKSLGVAAALLLGVASTQPQEIKGLSLDYANNDNFRKGGYEFTAGTAAFFSPYVATKNRPTYNYATGLVGLGYMLNDATDQGALSGNFEIAGELFGGAPFHGHGNYLAGACAWLRYNFVQPGWRVVPYGQLGVGVAAMDFDQRYFGQVFNFNLGIGLGVRYFVASNVSINAEYRYQHFSNAYMAENNLGINAQGGMLGVSWFF